MPDEIILKIQGDIRDLQNKIKKIETEFSGSGKKIKRDTDAMNSSFKNMGNLLKGALTAAALYKFKQGLIECAKAASNLEEQSAKFGTVFRGSLDKANQAVEDLTENFAMSEREAREFMAGIQDMLVPMGMARSRAAGFSGDIVKLAADLGSFNNIPTALAMNKIKSALVGMYRPMRDLGVVLSASTVEQRALADGLARTAEELTAADRAVTAYKMIVEGSADAIGDMARTHDSFANTMKRFNAQMEDFKASVGKYVIPALSWWADKLSIVIDYMDDVISKTTEAPQGRSMVEVLKMQIVDLRMEVEKYQSIIESGRSSTERAVASKKLTEATEDLAWAQEKLNRLLKAGKDVKYEDALQDQADAADDLEDNLNNISDALKKIIEQEGELKFEYMWGKPEMSPEMKKFIKENIKIEPYTEEGLERQRQNAKLIEGTRSAQDGLNKSWQEGITYVFDLGRAIDIAFSRASDKAQQLQNFMWSLFGAGIGFAIGGYQGAGWGAQIGSGVGQWLTSSDIGSTNRRTAELSNQAVNTRSYTAYRIGQ